MLLLVLLLLLMGWELLGVLVELDTQRAGVGRHPLVSAKRRQSRVEHGPVFKGDQKRKC